MFGLFSHGTLFDPSRDLPDLRGKVILVTGANTGIGYDTVRHLARRGAKVYLGARNEEKAIDALKEIEHEGLGDTGGEVTWLKVDFGSMRSAKTAAEQFLSLEKRLDVLINNAAQLYGPFEMTPEGISVHMTVNHFGPFILTRTLLPLLIKTSEELNSDVRVVTLTSWAHDISRGAEPDVQFREVDDFNSSFEHRPMSYLCRYSLTKLANLLFTRELQKRLDTYPGGKRTIMCLAVNPGTVNTGTVKNFFEKLPFSRLASMLCGFLLTSPEVGAYNSCFCAASSEVSLDRGKWKGAYVDPVGVIRKPGKNALREELARELWELTEKVLQDLDIYDSSLVL